MRLNRRALTFTCSIPIHERVELPDELIPDDSRVEIDAKITAGMKQAAPDVRWRCLGLTS